MTVDPSVGPRAAVPARGVRRARRRWLRHCAGGAGRNGQPCCAGAGASRRTGDLGRRRKPHNVRAPRDAGGGRGLDIRVGAGRRADMARPAAGSPAAAHGGGIRHRCAGALLDRARQSADVGCRRSPYPNRTSRLNPGGRVSARAFLDPGGRQPPITMACSC